MASTGEHISFDDYVRGNATLFEDCDSWEEVDNFTLALIELILPVFIHAV